MREKIRNILSQILVDTPIPSTLSDSDNLIEDLGLTSLDMMQFILKLEDEFEIEIDIDTLDFSIFNSMANLESFVVSCQAQQH